MPRTPSIQTRGQIKIAHAIVERLERVQAMIEKLNTDQSLDACVVIGKHDPYAINGESHAGVCLEWEDAVHLLRNLEAEFRLQLLNMGLRYE